MAIVVKLDELLRAVRAARTGFVDLEELSDAELARIQQEFQALAARTHRVRADAGAADHDAGKGHGGNVR